MAGKKKEVSGGDFSEELANIFAAHGQQLSDEEVVSAIQSLDDAPAPEGEEEDQEEDVEEEEQEESEEEQEEPEDDAEETTPAEATTPRKKLSPSEAEIVRLKAQRKALRDLLKTRTASQDKPVEAYEEEFKEFDDDAAKVLARSKKEVDTLSSTVELLQFQLANRKVLEKYQGAEEDAALIMERVKATGMTAEQICHGMYDALEPFEVRRQKASVRGELGGSRREDFSVAQATVAGAPERKLNPTREDKRLFEQLRQIGVPDLKMEEIIRLRETQ